MPDMPELYWSPTHGLVEYAAPDEYEPDGVWWRKADGRVSLRHDGHPNGRPSDAVRLVPAAQGDTTEAAIERAARQLSAWNNEAPHDPRFVFYRVSFADPDEDSYISLVRKVATLLASAPAQAGEDGDRG